jgi:uncharacterized protein YkwD
MKRRSLLIFVAIAASTCAAIAQPATEQQQLLNAISQARMHGCAAHAGVNAPLHWSDALSRAAARVDRGEQAMAAIQKEGYRATRAFNTTFEGYRTPAQVVGEFSRYYCAALTDGTLADMGFHKRGTHWVVLLAAPLTFPKLADARAVNARVLALVNEARSRPRRCGDREFQPAAPLQWNGVLAEVAAAHTDDMASHSFVEHRGSDGSTPAQRISRAGYDWLNVGENVAAGQPGPEEVVEDWLGSPGHCANIMEPAFTQIGVAFRVNMKAKTAVYWAQEFGRPAR